MKAKSIQNNKSLERQFSDLFHISLSEQLIL